MRILATLLYILIGLALHVNTLSAQVTYVVNTNDDTNDGNCNAAHCSLREAILASNSDGGQDSRIEFQIPGPNPQVIDLTDFLPNLTDDNTTIDATTQSGLIGDVVLDCSNLPAVNDHVIEVLGDRTKIFGLEIRNFDVKVGGNVIHIGNAGTSPQLCEIGMEGKGNIIHSVTNGTAGNGNFGSAIYIQRARFCVVRGNIIGTNRETNQALPIYNSGVFIESDPSVFELNYVGGSMPGQGNIIVACGVAGVVVLNGEGFIRQNFIGVTDEQATNQFPNGEGVFSATDIQIGGGGSLDGNYIGYNLTNGIRVDGGENNEIDQNHCFNNANFGIVLVACLNMNVKRNICFENDFGIGLENNSFDITVEQNEIHDNNTGLVSALVNGTQGHLITNNSFYCNIDEGIQIINNGYGSLPPPVITSTSPNEIRGTSRPNATIEVFRENDRNCPMAPCQGYSLLGTTTANGAGDWTLTGAFGGGYDAVCTQTDGRDNTSAFSNCVPVVNTCSFIVTNVADSGPGSLRSAIDCANNTPGPDLIEFDIPGAGQHVITPLTPLPDLIDEGTVIDGTTQPGNFPMAGLIILDGSQAGVMANGLNLYGNDCGLFGMVIRGFGQVGVQGTMTTDPWVSGIQIGSPNRGNVIINNLRGIEIWCEENCHIQSNYVGTDLTFQPGLGNSDGGIEMFVGVGDDINIGGDRLVNEGNYVCSNGGFGIRMGKDSEPNNIIPMISGNTVGTDATGTINLANTGSEPGIRVVDLDRGSVIGGPGGRGNIVAFHENGIGVTSERNQITRNIIYCNTVKGIELFGGTGNNNVVPPTIVVATDQEISGTSKPLDLIELFIVDNTGCPDAPCQGKEYVTFIFTDNFGNWRLDAPFPVPITNGMTITVTGTDGRQNTSEFSPCRQICDTYTAEADHAGPFCEGDPIQLLGDAPIMGTETLFMWTGPNGYTSTEQNPADATEPGRYVLTTVVDGCESQKDTVIVPDFIPSSRGIFTDRICSTESVIIGNVTFNIDNPIGETLLENAAANGCDSIVTVNLSFRNGGLNRITGFLCPGESEVVNGVEYNENNLSSRDTLPGASANGCDSVIQVNFTLLEHKQGIYSPILCPGQFVLVGGNRYDESNPTGMEILPGQASNGCDSIVEISLVYEQVRVGDLELPICPGGSFVYRGEVYTEMNPTGQVLLPGGASNGCDSLINISISLLPEPEGDLVFMVCRGESVTYNGVTYNEQNPTGQQRLISQASNGCDSLVNISLEFRPEPSSDVILDICPGGSIMYNGETFDEQNPTGEIRFPGMGSNGCDSVVLISVNVLPEPTSNVVLDICPGGSAMYNGTTYSEQNPSGQERLPGMGSNGCDSLVAISINVLQEPSSSIVLDICPGGSAMYNGTTYSEQNPAGQERLAGMGSNGCDSLVDVSINILTEPMGSFSTTICPNETLTFNGSIYDQQNPSGTERLVGQAANGCDSIVTVQLSFFPEARGTLDQQLCTGQQFVLNGEVFDENRPNGEVTLSGMSSNGCDSIVFVQLSFVSEITETISDQFCEGDEIVVNGTRYNISNPSGTERIPGGSVEGCDSVIIVDLTFKTLAATFSAESPSCPNTFDGRILVETLGVPSENYTYSVNSGNFIPANAAPFYIDGLGAGTQRIRIRDEDGCEFQYNIDVPGPAGLDLDLGPNLAILPGDQPILSPVVLSFTPVTISWEPSQYLSCSDCLSPMVVGLTQTETFTLTLEDANGCIVTDQITVFINSEVNIFVPNAFTPNGDGVNDAFNVTGNELIEVVRRLTIFDRWGVAVYDVSNLPVGDPAAGWDGLINGKKALPGVYAWSAEILLLNGETRILNGDVTLLR